MRVKIPHVFTHVKIVQYTLINQNSCILFRHLNLETGLYVQRQSNVACQYNNDLFTYLKNLNRTEAIKQTTLFVVAQSFTLSFDLQTTKSSTQVLCIYPYFNMVT